jgi:hypothetical protein
MPPCFEHPLQIRFNSTNEIAFSQMLQNDPFALTSISNPIRCR